MNVKRMIGVASFTMAIGMIGLLSGGSFAIAHADVVNQDIAPTSSRLTHEQKVRTYQLTENVLRADTATLLQEVLDYPYLLDVLFYDDMSKGIEKVANQFNGLRELLGRDDCVNILSLQENDIQQESLDNNITANEEFQTAFLSEAIGYTLQSVTPTRYSKYVQTTVYTSSGYSVSALRCTLDYDQNYLTYLDNYIAQEYPNAVKLRGATAMYNCHSYAWYSQSTSNNIWINYPLSFKTDGYYVSPNYWGEGNKVVYSDNTGDTHSAIIESRTGNGLSNVTLVSKWGACGLYRHKGNECPYTGSDVTATVYTTCVHTFSSYTYVNQAIHQRTCSKCGFIESETHSVNAMSRCYACGAKVHVIEPYSFNANIIG